MSEKCKNCGSDFDYDTRKFECGTSRNFPDQIGDKCRLTTLERKLEEARKWIECLAVIVEHDRKCKDDCKCSGRLAVSLARAFLSTLEGEKKTPSERKESE